MMDNTAKITPTTSDRCWMVCTTGGARRSALFTRTGPLISAPRFYLKTATQPLAVSPPNPTRLGTAVFRTALFVLWEFPQCWRSDSIAATEYRPQCTTGRAQRFAPRNPAWPRIRLSSHQRNIPAAPCAGVRCETTGAPETSLRDHSVAIAQAGMAGRTADI